MKLNEFIASVNIDGKYCPLRKGENRIGNLVLSLEVENKADGLYSWVVNPLFASRLEAARQTARHSLISI